MAQWHDAVAGCFDTLSIMRAGTHGIAATCDTMQSIIRAGIHGAASTVALCVCWLLEQLFNHEGWHTQHGRHSGTGQVLASFTLLSIMMAVTHSTVGKVA